MRMAKRSTEGYTRTQVIRAIEQLAPPDLSEAWDNTGLLLAPTRARRIARLLLTIDCTPAVVKEAISDGVDFIVSYHPPLFAPIQRLDPSHLGDRRLLQLIESNICLYSPHTSLDQAQDGISDWLADSLLKLKPGTKEGIPDSAGRLVVFHHSVAFKTLATHVQSMLRAPYLRVVSPQGGTKQCRSVALCAGAGYSAIAACNADVYLTGEMKHHDTLAASMRKIAVILSEHTYTERTYLPVLKRRLQRLLPAMKIQISRNDKEPITLFQSGKRRISR